MTWGCLKSRRQVLTSRYLHDNAISAGTAGFAVHLPFRVRTSLSPFPTSHAPYTNCSFIARSERVVGHDTLFWTFTNTQHYLRSSQPRTASSQQQLQLCYSPRHNALQQHPNRTLERGHRPCLPPSYVFQTLPHLPNLSNVPQSHASKK